VALSRYHWALVNSWGNPKIISGAFFLLDIILPYHENRHSSLLLSWLVLRQKEHLTVQPFSFGDLIADQKIQFFIKINTKVQGPTEKAFG
jgi:hypothetical protein